MRDDSKMYLILGFVFLWYMFLLSSCGPLTPHVDVQGSGSVGVGVSGTQTVSLDPTNLIAFFTTECTNMLGPTATQTQIAQCAATESNNFLSFFGQAANAGG